ncbi:MAG: methionine--tRNA ligase [Thermodesulfobacteriota bacterium]|nr:methionine--tRNA ligase [Thermodesulfobacteriota bacterium]
MNERVYITTPIYYVNDKPHVGHAYTSIACDSLARFYKILGRDVFFLTGTDEHGLKIQQSAKAKDIDTQAFVDKMSKNFQELTNTLMLTNNDFIRTTSEQHKNGARHFWTSLSEKDEIYLDKYSGWYSVRDEAYYQENELVEGKAPTGSSVDWVEEASYFFRLSKWQQPLLDFYSQNPGFVYPQSRFNEVIKFVQNGLRDLSVSRTSFDWGVSVPQHEGHVMYVWLDALVNYITALGYPDNSSERLNKYWPATYHIVGKDILRFHAIYWPAFLMAVGMQPPKQIVAHGWWTVEKEKMSKSIGNVVDPIDIINEFGLDPFRYFLLREVPFGNDGDFSRDAVISRINSELANNIGNLINRVYTMTIKNFDSKIPQYGPLLESEKVIQEKIIHITEEYKNHFVNVEFSKALGSVVELVSISNKYIDTLKPWSLAKENQTERLSTILRLMLETIRIVATMTYPVMPLTSIKVLQSLSCFVDEKSLDYESLRNIKFLSDDSTLNKLDLLFPKIDKNLG